MQSPSLVVTVFAFLLVLGPLVVVHEFGHYLVGRLFGVKADAFSVGFGKELAGWTDRRGTRWKLSALPLGGYVQFHGDWGAVSAPDASLASMSDAERGQTFHAKPLWQRTLIVLAGPLTNLVFAVAIFAAFNLAYGKMAASTEIAHFSPASAAQAAGLKVGDRIVAVDGHEVSDFTQIPQYVLPYPGKTVKITARRGDSLLQVPVHIRQAVETDEFGNKAKVGRIGVAAGKVEIERVGPGEAVALAWNQSIDIMRMMATGLGQIVTGQRSVKELGGPIKIAQYSGEQFTLGWPEFVSFAALISINLAFINLLPIPALDGGHLAFYAAEAVRRKPLDVRSQEWAIRTGIAFVLALMLFVTINDLATLKVFGG
jgi:regulator of sigma E protease